MSVQRKRILVVAVAAWEQENSAWTHRCTLALLLPAQVPTALSAGGEGNTLCLLVRPHAWILNSYVKSSLCLAATHALGKDISPSVKWGLLASGWAAHREERPLRLKTSASSSLYCHYYLNTSDVQKNRVHNSVINILCKLAYGHSSTNLQSLKILVKYIHAIKSMFWEFQSIRTIFFFFFRIKKPTSTSVSVLQNYICNCNIYIGPSVLFTPYHPQNIFLWARDF